MKEPTDALVIGSLCLEVINANYYGEATVNGIHDKNVMVLIRNLSTGNAYEEKRTRKAVSRFMHCRKVSIR